MCIQGISLSDIGGNTGNFDSASRGRSTGGASNESDGQADSSGLQRTQQALMQCLSEILRITTSLLREIAEKMKQGEDGRRCKPQAQEALGNLSDSLRNGVNGSGSGSGGGSGAAQASMGQSLKDILDRLRSRQTSCGGQGGGQGARLDQKPAHCGEDAGKGSATGSQARQHGASRTGQQVQDCVPSGPAGTPNVHKPIGASRCETSGGGGQSESPTPVFMPQVGAMPKDIGGQGAAGAFCQDDAKPQAKAGCDVAAGAPAPNSPVGAGTGDCAPSGFDSFRQPDFGGSFAPENFGGSDFGKAFGANEGMQGMSFATASSSAFASGNEAFARADSSAFAMSGNGGGNMGANPSC